MGGTPIVGAGAGTEGAVAEPEIEPIVPAEGEGEGGEGGSGEGEGTEGEGAEGEGAEGEGTEGAEGGEGGEGEGGSIREDGRLIPHWMRAMQKSNPEAYKAAKASFFALKDRESIHPTVQAAREDRDIVESLGGRAGVDKIREDVGFFHQASSEFLKGDPNFVKDLFEEDPVAAALHVPVMLNELKTRDFPAFRSAISKIWENDFRNLEFAPALQDLMNAVSTGNKDVATKIVKSIQEWHDSIIGEARKAEDPRIKTLLAERAKRQETEEQSRQGEFLKEFRTSSINTVLTDAGKTFDSFFRGKKIDAEDRNDLIREAVTYANRAVEADAEFMKQREAHLKRGDSVSAVKLTKARFAQEMTGAVQKIARRYGYLAGKGKPSAPANNNQQGGGEGNKTPVAQGFTRVNERPTADQINRRLTTDEMIVSGRAILTSGRKVDWSHLKRKL